MITLDTAFALAALATAGLDAESSSMADIVDTLVFAVDAARPGMDEERVFEVADRLARIVVA